MCVSKGAPAKPSYGPCNETHMPITWTWNLGQGNTVASWVNSSNAISSTTDTTIWAYKSI